MRLECALPIRHRRGPDTDIHADVFAGCTIQLGAAYGSLSDPSSLPYVIITDVLADALPLICTTVIYTQ